MTNTETKLLAKINARIADEMDLERQGVSKDLQIKIVKASQGRRVKVTATERDALISAGIFSEADEYGHGFHSIGSVQIVMSSKRVLSRL